MEIPASAVAVLESGRLAHVVTVNKDGSPHVTVVWCGVEGGEIVIGKLMEDQKVRNIRRDPRVSLSVEADGDQMGMQNYLVVEGTARVDGVAVLTVRQAVLAVRRPGGPAAGR